MKEMFIIEFKAQFSDVVRKCIQKRKFQLQTEKKGIEG